MQTLGSQFVEQIPEKSIWILAVGDIQLEVDREILKLCVRK
jgi:hypothetical protein